MTDTFYTKQLCLGFGTLRLPQNPDGSFPASTSTLLQSAYEKGIRYFDTGYEYLGGRAEALLGETLVARYPRENLCLADKLPVWRVSSRTDMERIFTEQLQRLKTDYIDCYLLHAMNAQYWKAMEAADVLSFLEEKQRIGQIRFVGFSLHDDASTLKTMLAAYNWNFCQLQINYYDWKAQHAEENYRVCRAAGIPITVMEPLGGGRLLRLPEGAKETIRRYGFTPAGLALHFFTTLPGITVVLTGATNDNQLDENLHAISAPLDKELASKAREKAVRSILEASAIPCTACKYCVNECPRGVDIPLIFQKYNDYKLLGVPSHFKGLGAFYFDSVPAEHQAHLCIRCGKCAKRCPQKIDIPAELKRVHRAASADYLGVTVDELDRLIPDGATVVCFGAGVMGKRFVIILESLGYRVSYFCDNASKSWGTQVDGIEIISPKRLSDMKDRAAVFIASAYVREIRAQLTEMGVRICN